MQRKAVVAALELMAIQATTLRVAQLLLDRALGEKPKLPASAKVVCIRNAKAA